MSQPHETEHYTNDLDTYDQQQHFDEDGQLTLRALVSTKEAGVIIGKGKGKSMRMGLEKRLTENLPFVETAGKNVAELRDATGVKAGVSKVVQGIHDRVLTVTGTLEGVAKVKKEKKQRTERENSDDDDDDDDIDCCVCRPTL
jgi:heterogeneous nuclear rnp K-like protein 2